MDSRLSSVWTDATVIAHQFESRQGIGPDWKGGQIGTAYPGVQANLLSQALRKLCGRIARAKVAVVVTNQPRQRAGHPGTPTYTAGGRALGYYASARASTCAP